MARESKKDRQLRLKAAGEWKLFVAFRTLLQMHMPEKDAERWSNQVFLADSSGPHPTQETLHVHVEEVLKQHEAEKRSGRVPRGRKGAKVKPYRPPAEIAATTTGRSPVSPLESATQRDASPSSTAVSAPSPGKSSTEMSPTPPPEVAESMPAAATASAEATPEAVAGASQEANGGNGVVAPPASPVFSSRSEVAPSVDPAYAHLLQAAKGRRASVKQEVEWVMENRLVAPSRIDDETVPSANAVSLLEWVQQCPENANDFLLRMYSKMVPTRPEDDSNTKFDDDGRSVRQLLAEFREDADPFLSLSAKADL